jgi:hypothetical protein
MGAAGRKRPVRGGRRCIPGLHTAPPAPSRQGMTVCSGGEERGGDPCMACGSRGGRRGGASSTTSSSSTATSAGYAHEWQAPRACRLLLSTSSHVCNRSPARRYSPQPCRRLAVILCAARPTRRRRLQIASPNYGLRRASEKAKQRLRLCVEAATPTPFPFLSLR